MNIIAAVSPGLQKPPLNLGLFKGKDPKMGMGFASQFYLNSNWPAISAQLMSAE